MILLGVSDYRIAAKVLKVQSADASSNFTNGTVVDSMQLSNLVSNERLSLF